MPKKVLYLLTVAVLFSCSVTTLNGHSRQAAAATPQGSASGFRADFLADWDDFSDKVVSLAEAMPAEKYSWRPGEGVRSVSELYMHIAAGNFVFMRFAGFEAPSGVDPRGLEKVADKAKVVELLKQSCEHVRKAILKTADPELDRPVELFGRASTLRNLFYVVGTHQHEHFGTAIAYARVNGVVPPWTAARQAQQQQKPADKPKP